MGTFYSIQVKQSKEIRYKWSGWTDKEQLIDEFISYLSKNILDIKKEKVKNKTCLLEKYGFEVVSVNCK